VLLTLLQAGAFQLIQDGCSELGWLGAHYRYAAKTWLFSVALTVCIASSRVDGFEHQLVVTYGDTSCCCAQSSAVKCLAHAYRHFESTQLLRFVKSSSHSVA